MSDATISTSSVTSISSPAIESFFGIQESTSDEVKNSIKNISAILQEQVEDPSCFSDFLRAVQLDIGDNEDKAKKVDSFFKHIKKLRSLKTDFKDYIKYFGVTIRDLESQARETGNWSKFLNRSNDNRKGLNKK